MGTCNQDCEIFSRVTGYYRPISNWNGGKREEFKDRKTYDVAAVMGKKPSKPAEKAENKPCKIG